MSMVSNTVRSDPVAFERQQRLVDPHRAKGRSESAAFLIWFLSTIYRLDEVDAEDAVCDQTSDMGIDALVVDDLDKQIVVVQAKSREKLPATLGDTELKKFVGTLAQFSSEAAV